jgi:hypothetical protein
MSWILKVADAARRSGADADDRADGHDGWKLRSV